MDKRQRGPADIDANKRLAVLANATADAKTLMEQGEHETDKGTQTTVAPVEVDRIIGTWPEAAKMGVQQMVLQYGQPNEGTPTKLLWFDRAPWKRILVTSDEVVHKFPTPHADFLTQYIDYEVPLDRFEVLGRYDGSCLIDRTMGEVAARCDSEAANFLTLNLMNEIVTGARTVEDARAFYSETLSAYCLGESAPHCEGFLFEPTRSSGDPDQPVSPGPKAKEITQKVEEYLSTSNRT